MKKLLIISILSLPLILLADMGQFTNYSGMKLGNQGLQVMGNSVFTGPTNHQGGIVLGNVSRITWPTSYPGTAGGEGQLQYYSGGNLGADPSLLWNSADGFLTIGDGAGKRGAITLKPDSNADFWISLANNATQGGGLAVTYGVYPTQIQMMSLAQNGILSAAAFKGSYLQGSSAGINLYPSTYVNLSASAIRMWGGDGTGAYVERGRMLNSGNFGVGTLTPTAELTVASSTGTSTVYILGTGATKGGRVVLEDADQSGCTEISALNGTLSAVTVTCP